MLILYGDSVSAHAQLRDAYSLVGKRSTKAQPVSLPSVLGSYESPPARKHKGVFVSPPTGEGLGLSSKQACIH
jgi:hypothetical protein